MTRSAPPSAYGNTLREPLSNLPPTVVGSVKINGMSPDIYHIDQRLAAIQKLLEKLVEHLDPTWYGGMK